MSTTLVQAAAAGVTAFSSDPVIKQFVVQLAPLLHRWLTSRGHTINEQQFLADYLLHGNLGRQGIFMEVPSPDGGQYPLRVVLELRAMAEGSSLFVHLTARGTRKGGWVYKDSEKIQLNYGDHPGSYKMQLVAQKMRALLNLNENTSQLDDTPVNDLLEALVQELCPVTA